MKRFAVVCGFLAMSIAAAPSPADEGPAKDVPELAVLSHYAGSWDVVIRTDPPLEGESTARWILGGRFLEQSSVVRSPDGTDIGITTLYTFDTQKKAYRSWSFVSTGSVVRAEMWWNAETKTMVSVTEADSDGGRTTITADFSKPDKESWKFVFQDRTGQQVGELAGENTRRSSSPRDTNRSIAVASDRPAEMAVLDRFLGAWRSEYRLPKTQWTPEEQTASADLVFSSELAGRFVRERGSHSNKSTSTLLLTYDKDAAKYRSWWFSSLGHTSEATGRWDEKSETLVWTGVEPATLDATTQQKFLSKSEYQFHVLIKNKRGDVLFRMEGKSVRAPAETK